MITRYPSAPGRRQALRAAVLALVALSGCQGSLRTWRRDEPSLRSLVVTPHPTDEAALRDVEDEYDSTRHRSSPTKNRAGKSIDSGRSNPYVAKQSDSEDESYYDIEDPELQALLRDADPAYRAQLLQFYRGMQALPARRQKQAGAHYAYRDEPEDQRAEDEEFYEEEPVEPNYRYAPDHPLAIRSGKWKGYVAVPKRHPAEPRTHAPAVAKKSSKSQRATAEPTSSVNFRFSDDEDSSDVAASEASDELAGQVDELGNRRVVSRSQTAVNQDEAAHQPDDRGHYPPVDQPENQTAAAARKPDDLKPPARSQSSRRTITEPIADTGLEQPIVQLAALPQAVLRKPLPKNDNTSSRKPATDQTATKAPAASSQDKSTTNPVDGHFTDTGVITASASSANSASKDAASSVQPAVANSTSSAQPNASATNKPTQEENIDWREQIQAALRAIEKQPVDGSATAQLNHHVTKRFLHVLLGNLNQALEPIPGLKEYEQEYYRYRFQAIYDSMDPRGNPVLSRRWPLVLESDRAAMAHLSQGSDLEVKNAAFCTNVEAFGVITKFPTYQFKPNQEVLLYCEVDNFVSRPIKDGYETKLCGTYEIFDANQTRLAQHMLEETIDVCNRPRRDYFFAYHVYMPQNIAPGRYKLVLTIEDLKGNKFGQTSLDLQIVQP